MEIELLPREDSDHYTGLKGGDPFSTAVNKKLEEYWVRTGHELNLQIAKIEVLSEYYNELHTPQSIGEDKL